MAWHNSFLIHFLPPALPGNSSSATSAKPRCQTRMPFRTRHHCGLGTFPYPRAFVEGLHWQAKHQHPPQLHTSLLNTNSAQAAQPAGAPRPASRACLPTAGSCSMLPRPPTGARTSSTSQATRRLLSTPAQGKRMVITQAVRRRRGGRGRRPGARGSGRQVVSSRCPALPPSPRWWPRAPFPTVTAVQKTALLGPVPRAGPSGGCSTCLGGLGAGRLRPRRTRGTTMSRGRLRCTRRVTWRPCAGCWPGALRRRFVTLSRASWRRMR